ncbi:MAG: hypothetical protein ACRBBR_04670 [Cellvibrionaceae bacterium]
MIKILSIIFACALSLSATADKSVEAGVRKSFDDNLKYSIAADIDGVLSTVHTQSLFYLNTKNLLTQVLNIYKLDYTLLDYQFISYDGELAYVRAKQRTTKISGPAFQNNEIDIVQVYKQEAGIWKLWAQANMAVKYIP